MFEQRRKDMVRPGSSAAPRPPGAETASRLPPARPPEVTSRSRRVPGAARPRIARAQHVQAFQAGQKQALATFRKATPRPLVGRAAALRPAPARAPKTVAAQLRKPVLTFPKQATRTVTPAAVMLGAPGKTRFAKPQLDRAALKRAGVNPQTALKAAAKRHAQAGALASGFLKRSRQQVAAVQASGRTLGRQIQAGAVRAQAQVRAAAGRAQGTLRGHFARSRARVTGRAASSRAQVTAQHTRTLAGLPAATRAARAKVTAAHTKAAGQARTGAQAQKTAVRAAYQAVVPQYAQAGDAVGAQARDRAETQARAYESNVTGENDSFLDGPLTDNRWKARAGAARDVGQAYAPGFREQADDEAQRLVGPDGGMGKDLSNIDVALQSTLKLLQEQLTASHKRLDARERQARTQAMSAYRSLTAALQTQLAGTLSSLSRAEGSSVAAVTRQAQTQAAGLGRQASSAQAGLQKSVQGVAGQLDRSLAGFDRQIRASQAPDPKQLAQLLAGAQSSVAAGMKRAQSGLGRSAAGLSAGLSQGAAQAGAALGQAAQSGGQQAAGLAGGFDQAGAGVVAQALALFQELTQAHRQGSEQEGQASGETLAGLTQGLEDLYGKTLSGLPAQLQATVGPLRKALEGNFTNEDAQIRQNAEEAAAQVQPRWKSWVKIALMVAVIIVVAVVAGPAVIGAVGAMAGALGAGAAAGTIGAIVGGAIVGAASGAVIQMANNAVDNIGMEAKYQKSVFDGVGKAALIGAAGGALGGAGGALIGKLGAMGALGGGLTQKAAGFALGTTFDLGGNVMGDVMGGMSLGDALKNLTNPETLMMMAIGTGAGVAAHGVATRNARAATPEGAPAGTGARPSLPERAQTLGERAGNRAGDVVNDLTGNRRGVVRTEVNPVLRGESGRVRGYTSGQTRVELSPHATRASVEAHVSRARELRAENSPLGKASARLHDLFGFPRQEAPAGSLRRQYEHEQLKHEELAARYRQEAAHLEDQPLRQRQYLEAGDQARYYAEAFGKEAKTTPSHLRDVDDAVDAYVSRGLEKAKQLNWPPGDTPGAAPDGHHWILPPGKSEPVLRRNPGYEGEEFYFNAQSRSFEPAGQLIRAQKGPKARLDWPQDTTVTDKQGQQVSTPDGVRDVMSGRKLSQDAVKTYQEQLEPVIRQRAEARAQEQGLTDRGLNMTEAELGELHRLRNEINKHSAQLGDYAAESYIQSRFSDAEQVTRLYGGADQPNRAGDFDQVWCVTLKSGEVHLVIIEAKGGSSPLGSRMTRAGRAQQGTPEYMNEIIEIMRGNRNNAAVMDAVDSALRDRTLTYMEVRAPIRSGTGGDESVGIEASDFILRPGQP